jgi:hypothetical protein
MPEEIEETDEATAPTADSILRTAYAGMRLAQQDIDTADNTLRMAVPQSVFKSVQPKMAKASGDLNTPIALAEAYIQANPNGPPVVVVTPPPVEPPPVVVTPPPVSPPAPPATLSTLAQIAAKIDPKFTVTSFDIDYTAEDAPPITDDWVMGPEGGPGGIWPPNYDSQFGYDVDTVEAIALVPGKGMVITTTEVSPTDFSSMMISDYGKHQVASGIPTLHLRNAIRPDCNSGLWTAFWALPDENAPAKGTTAYEEIDDSEGGLNNEAAAANTGKVPANANTALTTSWHGTASPPASTAPFSEVYDAAPLDFSKQAVVTWRAIYPGEKIVEGYVDPTTGDVITTFTITVEPPTVPHCDLLGTQVASTATKGWHTQVSSATPKTAELVIEQVAKFAYAAA